ncbi:MAG: tail fiber protein [Anaerolineae bacterium]|jgi:microcystin-dependent protein|nr:tail fiber protein [Anaerolineae bacterium]
MVDAYLSEIRIMAFSFPPRGWAFCNGQLLPINQNQALFSLLGTTYGGNGQVNFALPDFRGRVPVHIGNGFTLGERGGVEAHTIIPNELPQHTHTLNFSTTSVGNVNTLTNTSIPARSGTSVYAPFQSPVPMNTSSMSFVGGSQPHENRQPFLALSFCIALQGVFPSPT